MAATTFRVAVERRERPSKEGKEGKAEAKTNAKEAGRCK
jgi:hypothetical protein